MIKDSDIVFITPSLSTKWIEYQQKILKSNFPESSFIVIDGRGGWPKSWFLWIDEIKKTNHKWYVHIDEDCFIESKEQLLILIQKIEDEGYSLSAVSDAYHHYRGANPVAINSFFMVGKVQDILDLDLNIKDLSFWHHASEGWKNNLEIGYKEIHRKDFTYPHEIMGNSENCFYEQEPYYMVLWMLIERGKKFYYLYPHFDERFKSTNPRISKDSPDIAIHMWYTRFCDSPMDVHGLPNNERYLRLERYLNSK